MRDEHRHTRAVLAQIEHLLGDIGIETFSWVTTEFGLSLFAADDQQARLSYVKFVRDPDIGPDHSQKNEPGAAVDKKGQKISALPGKLVTPRIWTASVIQPVSLTGTRQANMP